MVPATLWLAGLVGGSVMLYFRLFAVPAGVDGDVNDFAVDDVDVVDGVDGVGVDSVAVDDTVAADGVVVVVVCWFCR